MDYNRIVCNTVKSIFPYLSVSSGEKTYLFASASAGQVTDDFKILFERYNSRKIPETGFSPWIFETIYEKERIKQRKEMFGDSAETRVNTDLYPSAYLYNLRLWDKYSKSRLGNIFDIFESIKMGYWIVLALFIVLPLTAWIYLLKETPKKQTGLCSLFSVFVTGFCAMGLSVILIYSYQNLYGYLFEKIGFLIALFMLGLAIGGMIVHYLIEKKLAGITVMLIVQIPVVLLCFMLPQILNQFSKLPVGYNWLFFFLVVVTGALTGHIFPLAAHLISENGSDKDRAASFVDSADHLGGCLGALLVGTFLTPFMGIANCAILLGVFEASAILLWIVYYWSSKKMKTGNLAE
jgi:spermidine synthase